MKILGKIFNRITFMAIVVVLEALLLARVIGWFNPYASIIETALRIAGLFVILWLVNNSRHLSSDIVWILLIMISPIFGTALYLGFGANLITSRTLWSIVNRTAEDKKYYTQDRQVMAELSARAADIKGQFRYISESAGFPIYRNTGFDYYTLGEEGYPAMLAALRSAKSFIFLEYFIIERGTMWDPILEILREKVAEGVDVRVMYDDFGSFRTLSPSYAKTLEKSGIKCVAFNRINPVIAAIMNHRDHRKILVVDGRVAFSGGINLADEYINVKERFGHWKDNVIRVRGDAVWSYTVLFLTMWNALRPTDDDYERFRPASGSSPAGGSGRAAQEAEAAYGSVTESIPTSAASFDGYIAPYGESPLDNEIVSQDIYMNIINQARDYVYIVTPYLIIDNEFLNALILAAKRGVDVRIVTPGIPDKKIIWKITRSYYHQLIEGGVKIIEYTPGFVHGKVFVSDDRVATVGTINLDFRSLYLHFENGTYIYGSRKIIDIRDAVLRTIAAGHQMRAFESSENVVKAFFISILRLFAPLM